MDSNKEELLQKTYAGYLNLVLKDFPIEKIDEIVDKDLKGFGSTRDEKFLGIQRFNQMVVDQREQGAGVEVQWKQTPIDRRVSPDEDVAIYTDEFTLSMKLEEGQHVIPLRLSSVFEFKKETWKLVHIHGSVGVETEENDTWHQEEWKHKQAELEKQVQEKTRELLEKNRELEIEAALERVRAKAMSMNKPDDLMEVCQIISEQLEFLKVKNIRNVQVAIIDEPNKNYENYQYFAAYKQKVFEETGYENNPASQALVREMQKSANSFFIGSIKDDELKEFKSWRVKYKQFPDPVLDKLTEVFYYFYSIGEGGLGLTTYKAISDNELEIYKRFHLVFKLAYRRFMDIQKAEKQARDAQIEAALERVRARSMGMHKSEELVEVVRLLDKEINGLGVEVNGSQILTDFANHEDGLNDWYAREGQDYLEKFHIPYLEHPLTKVLYNALHKGVDFYTENYSKAEKNKYFRLLFKYSDFRKTTKKRQEFIYNSPAWIRAVALFKNSVLIFQRFDIKEFTKEEEGIFKRFGKVFEQAYTRFLDLQKAEAQAREAQIEAALERLRSRTMGMQHSDELRKVVAVLYEEMGKLDFDIRQFALSLLDKKSGTVEWWGTGFEESILPASYIIHYREKKLKDNPFVKAFIDGVDQQIPFQVQEYKGEKKKQFDDLTFNHTGLKDLPEEVKQEMRKVPHLYMSNAFMKYGVLEVIGQTPVDKEKSEILQRFAKVFEQTYTRFLDLQKAEAQAREAQIQLALERVRARTMAMQHSDELADVSFLLNKQVVELGIPTRGCAFNIYNEHDSMEWFSNLEGTLPTYKTPRENIFLKYYEAGQRGETLLIEEFGKERIRQHYEYMYSLGLLGNNGDEYKTIAKAMPESQIDHVAYFKYGYLLFITLVPAPEAHDIFKRFAKEFEQTYTRFLDLKKAEEQAREAQIEAALERVRSKALAMHNSNDLSDAASQVFTELRKLGISPLRSGVGLIDKESRKAKLYSATLSESDSLSLVGWAQLEKHPVLEKIYESWLKQNNEEYFPELQGEQLKSYYQSLLAGLSVPVPDFKEDEKQFGHFIFCSIGGFYAWSDKPYSQDQVKILKRFTSIIELTFKRYFDLQKAEEQAREAQIEAALEKVRSRSLAMHTANELGDVVTVIVEKLLDLGVVLDANGVVLCTYFQKSKDVLHWIASPDFSFAGSYLLPYFDHPIFNDAWASKESGDAYFSKAYSIEEKNSFFEYAFEYSDYKHFPDDFKQWVFQNDQHILSFAWQKNSAILIPSHTGVIPSEGEISILKRFAKVFEQAYVRFMDLQKAEAQAREAQIEAALEKVRSRTMGMQRSDELQDAAILLFDQVKDLGVNIMGCGFNIWDKDKKEATVWMSGLNRIQPPFKTSSSKDIFVKILEASKRNESLFIKEQAGEELIAHYRYMASIPVFRKILENLGASGGSTPSFQIVHCAFFSQGYLMFITTKPVPEAHDIFKRFAKVFEQTYTRFLDLQKAEDQAREAKKQASLDRVRGEIASMRTSEDLNRITPVIWRELQALEVPFFRCGVFIIDEKENKVRVYLTTPGGKALGVLNLALDANELTKNTVDHWKNKRIFKTHWNREEFINWTKSMVKMGQVENEKTYQGAVDAPESLNLHFVPFKQGMLYVGDASPLSEEKTGLVKTLAEAFSIAYARYEDFKNLEEAKNKIELTLSELKSAQKQLVQSEKMASLGELTAGIAHEIQNPLNFVNNFSELSNELLEELKEEIVNGNNEEVKALAEDVIQNLQKINHHGKRAEGIIKGMLLHSRGNSGKKEPTDINKLADEYLRLSYHGLRAKDKSFNADFKLEADESLPELSVVPQDIGRVLLNLINNAFFAVNDKLKQNIKDYKPTVLVKTKSLDQMVEIVVEDNGSGIPEQVMSKIFQPFFTTKPTGQGTGLGLSMSYEIVTKGHDGELKVESKEKQRTSFIITLPKK